MTHFRPMLATDLEGEPRFPVLASPKLDGVRALSFEDYLMSRSMKPIPNVYTQALFAGGALLGFDGELIVGSAAGKGVMQRTMSGVMTIAGTPKIEYHVFDLWNDDVEPFAFRYARLAERVEALARPFVKLVPHEFIETQEELLALEEQYVSEGYEGMMIRDPNGPYKQGRSTLREGWLLKVKRWRDDEATIVGTEELMHNDNEATKDERGYTKRSTHQANQRASGMLGALVCTRYSGIDETYDETFKIGAGFTEVERKVLWAMRKSLEGQIVKYKHFPSPTGVKDKPRHPIYLGLRSVLDL